MPEFPISVPANRPARSEISTLGKYVVVRQIACSPAGQVLTVEQAEDLRAALAAAIQGARVPSLSAGESA